MSYNEQINDGIHFFASFPKSFHLFEAKLARRIYVKGKCSKENSKRVRSNVLDGAEEFPFPFICLISFFFSISDQYSVTKHFV